MSSFAKSMVFAACLVAFGALEARADSIDIDFFRVTNNASSDVADQFHLEILDYTTANSRFSLTGTDALGSTEVLFVYTNDVGIASAISEVFIDDGTVVSMAQVYNSLGGYTDFGDNGTASPGNLPGGNTVNPVFIATAGFSSDAVGNPDKGVNHVDDILGMSFVVSDGLSGLRTDFANGTIRVGIHVRAIGGDNGESDSFVNIVPEPGSFALTALGLVVSIGMVRRRRRRA